MARVTRPGGRIVILDAAPSADKQVNYNLFEVLRDPSHTRALTAAELMGLAEGLSLTSPQQATLGLDVDAQELVHKAHPAIISQRGLEDMLALDVGRNP